VGCGQRLVLHHRVPRWSVNGAKNKAGLMTSTVMVAKTASLWASLASCAEKKWQKTLNKLGDSYRIGKKNRAAAAPVCALLTRGSKLNNRLTQRERRHLAAVKEMPCGVCGAAGPRMPTTSSRGSSSSVFRCARTVIKEVITASTVARRYGMSPKKQN
jgi:hypothetical protein